MWRGGAGGLGEFRNPSRRSRMPFDHRRRAVLVAAAVLALAALVAGAALAASRDARGPDRYMIALIGDLPYNALGRAQYPNLIAAINDAKPAFSVFDGDLKAGGDGACTDQLY